MIRLQVHSLRADCWDKSRDVASEEQPDMARCDESLSDREQRFWWEVILRQGENKRGVFPTLMQSKTLFAGIDGLQQLKSPHSPIIYENKLEVEIAVIPDLIELGVG